LDIYENGMRVYQGAVMAEVFAHKDLKVGYKIHTTYDPNIPLKDPTPEELEKQEKQYEMFPEERPKPEPLLHFEGVITKVTRDELTFAHKDDMFGEIQLRTIDLGSVFRKRWSIDKILEPML
jgi:hypothetical protein